MPRHLLTRVAESPQCRVDGIFAHRSRAGPDTGKNVPSMPRYRVELLQNGKRLRRKRHDMLLFHLHPAGGDAPLRMIEVELGPFSLTELPRSNKGQNTDKERAFRFKATGEAPNRTHQCADFLWIRDRRVMLLWRGLECLVKISRGIMAYPPSHRCISEDLPAFLRGAMGCINRASPLDPPQRSQSLHRRDFRNRALA